MMYKVLRYNLTASLSHVLLDVNAKGMKAISSKLTLHS